MPIYDYKCLSCGRAFEKRMLMAERYTTVCECGGEVKIQLGVPVVIWAQGPPTLPNLGVTNSTGMPNKPSDDEIDDGILGPDGDY